MGTTRERRPRTRTEYRVICEREGGQSTEKRFASIARVRDRIGLLTSKEPWRYFGEPEERERDGDALMCCDGSECGCGGLTLREDTAMRRKGLPPVVSIRVERRHVTRTPWELFDVDEKRIT